MNLFLSLLLYLSAGLINGSFATPVKYIKIWNFENIWLQHSIWAFIILPWITILFLAPQVFEIYHAASTELIIIMALGGFLFGIGQIASARAIHIIGIGLTFVVCIGVSTALGFFLPLAIEYPEKITTPFGYLTIFGVLLAILGFIFSTYAGSLRSKLNTKQNTKTAPKAYIMGTSLALIAGVFSAGQNLCFTLTSSLQKLALSMGATKLGAALIMWPVFLISAFIPYAAYMIYLFHKNSSFSYYRAPNTSKFYLSTFIMGVFWYGSLMLYSKASQIGGSLAPIFGWPIFMVLIILTSNCWGWVHNEWKHASQKALRNFFIGLVLLIVAMLILGVSSYLNFDHYV